MVHLGFPNFYRWLHSLPQETLKDLKIVFLIGFLILNQLSRWRWSCNFSHQMYTACDFYRWPSPLDAASCWQVKPISWSKKISLWAWCVRHDSIILWSLGHLFFTHFSISVFKAFHSRWLTDVSKFVFIFIIFFSGFVFSFFFPSYSGKTSTLAIWMPNSLFFLFSSSTISLTFPFVSLSKIVNIIFFKFYYETCSYY